MSIPARTVAQAPFARLCSICNTALSVRQLGKICTDHGAFDIHRWRTITLPRRQRGPHAQQLEGWEYASVEPQRVLQATALVAHLSVDALLRSEKYTAAFARRIAAYLINRLCKLPDQRAVAEAMGCSAAESQRWWRRIAADIDDDDPTVIQALRRIEEHLDLRVEWRTF